MLTLRLRLVPTAPDDTADGHMDEVLLADGQVLAVPRGNLAAAKALLAAQKAAVRRVGGTPAPTAASYSHRNDMTGLDSGVRPVEARIEEPLRWLRAEEMRAEKAS
ncbi:MAG TPA: hypothetical protein VF116_01500 [Ktedonobacterales bacterium]